MDSHTVAQLTHILSEEAQMISEELKTNAQNMSPDAIVAKLDGLVTRMKYELRNKGPDASSYEFPIYDSSYHSVVPLPDPNNYLYEKRHNEAAYPSVKENFARLSFLEPQPKPLTKTKSIPSSLSTYPHPHKSIVEWRFVQSHPNPHKTSKKSVDDQSKLTGDPLRRSCTEKKSRSHSTSYAIDLDHLKHITNSKSQKIVVNVINDKPSSKKSINWEKYDVEPIMSTKSQKSILKANNGDKRKESVSSRKTRSTRSSAAVTELDENTGEGGNAQTARRSQSKPKAEHVKIIDRRISKSTERKQNKPKRERLRSSKTHTMSNSIVPVTPLSRYILQPPPLYNGPPMLYPPSKPYTSMPRYNYPVSTQFSNTNSLYPFLYYRY